MVLSLTLLGLIWALLEPSWTALGALLDPLGHLSGLPFGFQDDGDDDDDDDDNPPGSMPRFSSILDRSLFPLEAILTSFWTPLLAPFFLIFEVHLLIHFLLTFVSLFILLLTPCWRPF